MDFESHHFHSKHNKRGSFLNRRLRGRVVIFQPEGRRFDPQSAPSACRSVLGQDTEPLNGPSQNKKVLWIKASAKHVLICVWIFPLHLKISVCILKQLHPLLFSLWTDNNKWHHTQPRPDTAEGLEMMWLMFPKNPNNIKQAAARILVFVQLIQQANKWRAFSSKSTQGYCGWNSSAW